MERSEPTSFSYRALVRDALPAWAALVVVAILAWWLTIDQARAMGVGVGTMGMSFPAFVLMWVAMMAAMMFPSVAPIALLWTQAIMRQAGRSRALRIAAFITGYITAWAAYGLVAFAALVGADALVQRGPDVAPWVGAVLLAGAGLYQLTPAKDRCLKHCRAPLIDLIHYSTFKGRLRDLRVGLHHGLYCVGCCWSLMVVLVLVGIMNIAAMALVAAVIFFEKIWRHGVLVAKAVAVVFIVGALFVPWQPSLLPGLHGEPPATTEMEMDNADM